MRQMHFTHSSLSLSVFGRSIRVFVFNCTGERSASELLGPIAQRQRHFGFQYALFTTNAPGPRPGISDQVNLNAPADPTLAVPRANSAAWCALTEKAGELEVG